MDWIKVYHDDHMSVLFLLSKLQGNLQDLATTDDRPNVVYDLQEFGDVINKVLIPHFKSEEETVYPKAATNDKAFVDSMYQEHKTLYELFDRYLNSLNPLNKDEIIAAGNLIISLLKEHIQKEETVIPKLLAHNDR